MKNRNKKLMAAMVEADVSRTDMGEAICRSQDHISKVINYHSSPSLYDAYAIMKLIGKRPEDVAEYFPPDVLPDDFAARTKGGRRND